MLKLLCYVCKVDFKDEEELRLHSLWAHGIFRKHCENPNSLNYFNEEKLLKRDLDVNVKRKRLITKVRVNHAEVSSSILRLKELGVNTEYYEFEFGSDWGFFPHTWQSIEDWKNRYSEKNIKKHNEIIDKELANLEMIKQFQTT